MAAFFPKLALASAMVAAATLPASAQTYVAVIWGNESIHYFASPGDTSYLGDTESGMHLCAASRAIIHNNSRYAQFFLPNGRPIYTFWTSAAGAFSLDPANDKKCQENAALYTQQAAQSARRNFTSSSPVASSQPPQVQSKPVAPNYGSSEAGATTFIDDAMRADLKEVLAANGTQSYPRGVLTGLPGDDEQRASVYEAEPVGNYFYYRKSTVGVGGIHWWTDKDMQDFVKARRWYQLALRGNPVRHSTFESDIKNCDFNLSDANGSARSEIAEEKNRERIASEESKKKLAARKKVGDCVVMPGGTGFLGLGATIATVTGVSGDTVSWVAHLHRNGYWYQGIGVKIWNSPQDFDREGSSKYNELSLCDQH